MNEITGSLDGELPLHGIGDRLRMAREAAGMTLEQLAAETRIPLRHLEHVEAGEWHSLPARTYATGFARTYAKAVGLDPRATVEEVREELAAIQPGDRSRAATFEPGDPARIPSRGLALFSLFAVIILLVGGFMFYSRVISPGSGPGSLLEEERLASKAASRAAAASKTGVPVAARPAGGRVVFTALEEGIWVKFYDGSGRQLMQKQMSKGETYTVPEEAERPQVWTGRPDALAITVGGRAVPKLADAETIVRDVPVTAEALLARGAPTPAAAASAAAVGT